MRDLLQANAARFQRLLCRGVGMAEKYKHVLVSSLDQLRVQRSAQRGIQHNPQQRPAPRQVAAIGQQRIVGEDRSHPHDQCIRGVAHAMHFGTSFIAADPKVTTGRALCGRDAAVERSGNLHGDERKEGGDELCEAVVEPAGLLLEHAGADLDPSRTKPGDALTVNHADWGRRWPPPRASTPAAISASAQGPVRPWWLQGSRVTYAVAPRARGPACFRATISAWSRRSYSWKPSPTTASSRTSTQPTAGLGEARPTDCSACSQRTLHPLLVNFRHRCSV